jgi:hypothetical protein
MWAILPLRGPADLDLALKEDDADGALRAFQVIVNDQPEKGEWFVPQLSIPMSLAYGSI